MIALFVWFFKSSTPQPALDTLFLETIRTKCNIEFSEVCFYRTFYALKKKKSKKTKNKKKKHATVVLRDREREIFFFLTSSRLFFNS